LSGSAFCWGDNSAGQLGIGKDKKVSVVPVAVASDLQFTSVVAAGQTTCATTQGGEVYCWGANAAGQFGGPPSAGSTAPVRAFEGFVPAVLSLGPTRACALAQDGTATCWGSAGEPAGGPADR
jgi:hypothetical protein